MQRINSPSPKAAIAPDTIETIEQIEDILSEPTHEVVQALADLDGDIMILGAAGKMGPNVAMMAAKAIRCSGVEKKVYAVARTIKPGFASDMERLGVETISADLFDKASLDALPSAKNVVFMAGRKFGSVGDEWTTWATNAFLPGIVAERFRDSRIVIYSTGNVYPLTPIAHGGADENTSVAPVGEYAQSCLGRERIFEHFSIKNNTPCLIFRLCYAVELRYGIILDIAQKVWRQTPVDLTMGHAAAIWQGDAVAQTLRCFEHCQTPPAKLVITGPEMISIRWLAAELGKHMGKQPVFAGEESPTALVFNAAKAQSLFGYPSVPLNRVIQWVAHWVKIGGPTLNKPTHFEQRDGSF